MWNIPWPTYLVWFISPVLIVLNFIVVMIIARRELKTKKTIFKEVIK